MDLPPSAFTGDCSEATELLNSLKEGTYVSKKELPEDGKEMVVCDVLLPILDSFPRLARLVCETVAELAKKVEFRTVAAEEGTLMSRMVLLLKNPYEVQLEAMRAIGNLCYDHDPCRQQFLDCGGCAMLANVLSECSQIPVGSLHARYKAVACGATFNVCNDNEAVSADMIKEKAVEHLVALLSKVDEEESVVLGGIRAIMGLVDTTDFDVSVLSSAGFAAVLDLLLKRCGKGELDVLEELMDLISTTVTQSEGSEATGANWLRALAESGCVETLLNIDEPEHLQTAVDNVIRLLSEDTAMQSLFDGGALLAWSKKTVADESVGAKMRASAALALANMARNDSNCEVMIKDNVLSALADILLLPANEENCQLLYSALSALRNLSLPDAHKMTFLHDKVVDQVMAVVINSSDSNVLFKAFGCLRLLSARTEICRHIVQTESVLEKICQFCADSCLPQIKTEGSRLMASLIKNSNSQDSVIKIVEQGGTKMLVFLLGTDHAVTKNEGLIALSIAAAVKNKTFTEALVESDFAGQLASLMKSCDNVQMLHNCLVLMKTLIATNSNEVAREVLASDKLSEVLLSLNGHEDSTIREKSTEISLVCT